MGDQDPKSKITTNSANEAAGIGSKVDGSIIEKSFDNAKDFKADMQLTKLDKAGDKSRIDRSVDHEGSQLKYAEENEPFLEEVHNEPENFESFLEDIKSNVPQFELIN